MKEDWSAVQMKNKVGKRIGNSEASAGAAKPKQVSRCEMKVII